MKINSKTALLTVFFLLVGVAISEAQVRSGIGFLKVTPGARQFGIAGSMTGALDYTDSFFANPGAGGMMREWYWSASYTNWISDIYNASFFYGRQVRTPWARRSYFVLGASYLGIREFDSSDGASPLTSGHDLLLTANIGQPLTFLTENLAAGVNVKYFDSELADFQSKGVMVDFGLLYRTPRFDFLSDKFLEYAIFSAGLAVTNVGKSLTYLSEATPLPRTLRAGIALHAGSHDAFQVSLSGDYRRVQDEDGFVSIGSEFSWTQWIALRWGYSFEDNLLGHFTFGASVRLDDRLTSTPVIPGRNNALRIDLAANQSNDFTSAPFQGSATHHPIGPDGFRLISPAYGASIKSDSLTLIWESSRDADLYDNVGYWLIMDRDSLQLVEMLAKAEEGGEGIVNLLTEDQIYYFSQQLNKTHRSFQDLESGHYFWAVFAYDRDTHMRFGEMQGKRIARFDVTAPQLQITDIEFDYNPWITDDDYQGVLKVTLSNVGNRTARNFSLAIYDSLGVLLTDKLSVSPLDDVMRQSIATNVIPDLAPANSSTLEFEWSTKQMGAHFIIGEIYRVNKVTDAEEITNREVRQIFTIPKGKFATFDTVLTQALTGITYELPYVGKVFFDSSSATVKPKFTDNWVIEPPLVTLATRLRENPDLRISLQGTADPNSGEEDAALGNTRAASVREALVTLGAREDQIEILAGTLLEPRRLPQNPEDAGWILQERRRVDVLVDENAEEAVFKPLQTRFSERVVSPVTFSSMIEGAVQLQTGYIKMETDGLMGSFDVANLFSGSNLIGNIAWQYRQTDINLENDWHNTNAAYTLVVTDSLGRTFKTQPQSVFLKTESINRERMYFGVAKFAKAEPLYSFYWANLLERIPFLLENKNARLRFIGHACAIGPEPVNQRLSEQRAKVFYDRFLEDVKKFHPDLLDEIKTRLDPPEGFGETKPFFFKGGTGETIILGDNSTPTGRQMNRRVIALIYSHQ